MCEGEFESLKAIHASVLLLASYLNPMLGGSIAGKILKPAFFLQNFEMLVSRYV